jgi:tetratricopeptide (TPR) repeat protein
MIPCPAADTLARFLAADLDEAEAEATRGHVRGCPTCQAALDDLSDNADLRRAARRPPGPEGPALRRALAALRATPPGWLAADTPAPPAGKPPPFLGPPTRPGDLGTLGPYEIEAEIGRGGMGLVFRARDPALARVVAVKMLRPGFDDTARRRLVREARAAAQCRHDHLVGVHAVVDPPDGPPYLVMEYLAGPTLAAMIREGGPLGPCRAAALVAQVADGLAAAHAAGLVHRDVKPGNILLDPATGRAKLADFGLARDPTAGVTLEGAVAGTPAYMSPERADGRTAGGAPGDVYALGVTLYEALTGEVPFRGAPHMVLRQAAQDEPRPPRRLNDKVPRDLETVCLKAMAKEPAARYPSAAALADDLRRFLAGEPVRARPTGPLGRGVRWCRRRPALATLAAALVLALAAGGAGVVWQWRRAEAAAAAARHDAAEAEEQRQRAEASLRDALAVVDEYLTSVSEGRLLNEPGSQPLRKELLGKARDFYRHFTEEHGGDPRLSRELARSHYRLGHVVYMLDGPARGAGEFEKAVALEEKLADEAPGDPARRLELAQGLNSLGVCYENGGRLDDAMRCYGRVLDITHEAPTGDPAADEFRLLEARAHINRGKTLAERRQWAEQEPELNQAIAITRGLVERGAKLPDSRRVLAIASNNLGDLCRFLGRADEAQAALTGAVAGWEELLREVPGDLAARFELTRSLHNLGDLALARRRPRAAAAV